MRGFRATEPRRNSRVVGSRASSSKDDMDVLVPVRLDDRSHPSLGHTHETMRMLGRPHGIDGHTGTPIRPVLEPDRERDTRGQLPVQLGLGGSSSDGSPGDEVRDELRGDGIEQFGTDGHAHRGDVDHEFTGESETFVDLERVVDVGVAGR
jgi:hypothetical protein